MRITRAIRRAWERSRKGYCYEDLWMFDHWLSKMIARGLREVKANCHTYPSQDITWEEWLAVLDEMAECFEEQTRGIDNLNFDGDFMETWRKRQEHQKERLHRGLELLERYYYDLWD